MAGDSSWTNGPVNKNQVEVPQQLDQFALYKEFVETILWPAFESVKTEIKRLVEDMEQLEAKNSWSSDTTTEMLARIQNIQNQYDQNIVPLITKNVRNDFGPSMRIQSNVLSFNSYKIFHDLQLRILERDDKSKGSPLKMTVQPLLPFAGLVNKFNFTKDFVLSLAQVPEEIDIEIPSVDKAE